MMDAGPNLFCLEDFPFNTCCGLFFQDFGLLTTNIFFQGLIYFNDIKVLSMEGQLNIITMT